MCTFAKIRAYRSCHVQRYVHVMILKNTRVLDGYTTMMMTAAQECERNRLTAASRYANTKKERDRKEEEKKKQRVHINFPIYDVLRTGMRVYGNGMRLATDRAHI